MVECKICKEPFENSRSLSWHLKKEHKIDQKSYYDKYLKIENEGICKNCGRCTTMSQTTAKCSTNEIKRF